MIGSFLNVLIYRLPRGIDYKFQRSFCPQCKHLVHWYENVPILSYLLLRGKCAHCKAKIPWRYPVIELAVGVGAWLLFPQNLNTQSLANFIFYFSVFAVFLTHAIIDLEHKILPDILTLYLLVLFLIFSAVSTPWTHWAIGGAIGFLGPFLVTYGFYKLRGQIGLGGGDIKLFGTLGIFLGPMGIIQNMFWSCMLGAFVGLILIALKRMDKENPIPFGPFIIIIAFEQIFFPRIFNLQHNFLFGHLF